MINEKKEINQMKTKTPHSVRISAEYLCGSTASINKCSPWQININTNINVNANFFLVCGNSVLN